MHPVKRLLLTLCCVLAAGGAFAALDFSGVQKLAGRLGGAELTSKIVFEAWLDASAEKAQIVPGEKSFTIRATSVHAATLALGVYLREVAKGHISWCGKRMPTVWKLPTRTIDVAARYPYAMAYNYCTLSYTMAFWGKAAWQEEIDRLALSGYSQALVMAGVQKIWALTLADMGYTLKQREDFITDDAVQAWWLMGNLQASGDGTAKGHYPVVSDELIEKDAETGRFIVAALREVGIEPIFQGFIGLVPSSTTERQLADRLGYDAADTAKIRIFRNGNYVAGQKNPDLIDPTCAAFKAFSDTWNANLKRVYGMTDAADYPKYLGGDLFHESAPPKVMTTDEKVNCAKFVQQYQQAAFPGVVWVLQSWQGSPDQNLRNGLDPAHTLIQYLDQTMSATGDRRAAYVNQTTGAQLPWVWVEVMNFGGNTGMHGAFRRFRNIGNLGEGDAHFCGYGMLSEGLETNPISYDMFNSRFTETTRDAQNIAEDELGGWMEAYRLRRYGYTDDHLKAAYEICAATVWNCERNQQGTIESVFCANPRYEVANVSQWGPASGTPYEPSRLVEAAEHFLAAAKANPALLDLETFRYDFVEIFQQILADRARQILSACATSEMRRTEFRQMLELVERILACSDDWRLDKKEARTVEKGGPTTGPAAYRRMITTWTPGARGQTVLSQYAHRSYAGLVKHYYAKKWNGFFDVKEGKMTAGAYRILCDNLDRDFPTQTLAAPPTDGDPIAIAEEILAFLKPQTLVWNESICGEKTTTNIFTATNWLNAATGKVVAWKDGSDAVISVTNLTLVTTNAVMIGSLNVRSPVFRRGGSVTLSGGPYKIMETLKNDDKILTFTGDAIIGKLVVGIYDPQLRLGAGKVTIGAVSTMCGCKLVLTGTDETLVAGRITISKADLAKVVYCGPNGVRQTLECAADGTARSMPGTRTYAGELSTNKTSLGWTDLTPFDSFNLLKMEFTSTLGGSAMGDMAKTVRGSRIMVNSVGSAVSMLFSENAAKDVAGNRGVFLNLTCAADGLQAQALPTAGYTLKGLTATPARARMRDFAPNYEAQAWVNFADLGAAIRAAKGGVLDTTRTVTLIRDTMTDQLTDYPARLEIAEGVEFTANADDFLKWEAPWSLDVRGTLLLGRHPLSYGQAGHRQKVTIYEGGRVANTSGRGLSVFQDSTIYVKAAKGRAPARLEATLQARANITIEVEAGARAVAEAEVKMKEHGDSGIISPKIVKTGAGELTFNCYGKPNAVSYELAAGTLRRALAPGETFVLTITGGTADITAQNADSKVVESVEGNVHAYICRAKTYLFYVTKPGATSVNMPGTGYEDFATALAAAKALQAAHPAQEVKLWIMAAEVFDAAMEQLNAYNKEHGTNYTQFGDGNGNEIQGWNTAKPMGPCVR